MHKIQCKDTFENCEKKVTEVINKLGMTLFAIIDHSGNAERVGLSLGKTKLFLFGNPSVGTLLMQNNREIGYDLPLRVLLWEDGGNVYLSYKLPSEIAKDYGLESTEVVKKMDAVFKKVLEAASV